MSKMNITLGVWRLWVLLAVCWVGALTIIKFDDLTATWSGGYDPKLANEIIDPYNISQIQIDKNKQIQRARLCRDAKNFYEIRNSCDEWLPIDGSITVSTPIWSKRLPAMKLIILPPLGLLLLGLGIGWVVKGFRRPA